MANRLADQTSPYLLQHRDNPVDWWPWCDEALELARTRDLPILLSIGYSSCHWCHVMERESFEDVETAEQMNRDFVCIKVDREERPDIDAIYMEAVQSMTGQGGWPLTVFCDPNGVPFYGGTYFPPQPRQGMPSFRQVLDAVTQGFRDQREEIDASASEIRARLGVTSEFSDTGKAIPGDAVERARASLIQSADLEFGGFGGAPKFPPCSVLGFLIRQGEREVAATTLDAMMCGGICDQLGGGFARYAVDQRWLIPHFEQMLYDNALLAGAYVTGWQQTGNQSWRDTAIRTLNWCLLEMQGDEGGFYSALDADSEGREGAYYLWDEAEMRRILAGSSLTEIEIEQVLGYWGVSPRGNFEGQNILHIAAGPGASPPGCLSQARDLLLAARSQRIKPSLDDKRICSWNALMVSALSRAGSAFGTETYLRAALDCAGFILEEMRNEEGRLFRTWKDGNASLNAYLEDHALLLEALLDLHAATLDPRWFVEAEAIANLMLEYFEDAERGGFFTTSHDHEKLLVRRKDLDDHPIPSATSSAALGLLRLSMLSGDDGYRTAALRTISPLADIATEHPTGFGHLLQAMDLATAPDPQELAIVYPPESAGEMFPGGDLAEMAARTLLPHTAIGGGPSGAHSPRLIEDRTSIEGAPTAYLCRQFSCREPVTRAEDLARQLTAE